MRSRQCAAASARRFARSACLAVAVAALATPTRAAEGDETASQVPSAHARISFERATFPGDEPVGLLGTTYLVDVSGLPGVAIGPAVYGAITGHRGGFFTIGGEAAWRQRLIGPIGIELGLYVGGGGGGGALQGGGLMLRPHVDLLADLGTLAVGVSLSHIEFPNGQISSTQWGLVLNVNDQFKYTQAAHLDTPERAGGRTGIGFDRIQIVGGAYRPRGGATLLDGRPEPTTISLIGVRADQAIGRNAYWGLEANGAAQGNVAGYAEYLGTVGVETELVRNRLTVGGRVALGMGGGGGIRVGSGLLAKASLYGIVRLSDSIGISFEGGLTDAPRGEFRAAQAAAGLIWALDGPHSGSAPARPVRTDFSAGVERYDAPRGDGSTRALTNIVLKADRFVDRNVYLTGQVHSGVAGGAGGYTSAFVGAGWWQPFGPRWHVAGELLAGAAGGGGVDTGGARRAGDGLCGLSVHAIGGTAPGHGPDQIIARAAEQHDGLGDAELHLRCLERRLIRSAGRADRRHRLQCVDPRSRHGRPEHHGRQAQAAQPAHQADRPEAQPRARQVDAQEESRQAPAQGRLSVSAPGPVSER